MARPKKLLTDKEAIIKTIEEYKKYYRPTLAGLLEALKVKSLHVFYKAMDQDDEIGTILTSAYIWLVKVHEEQLYGNKPVAHIFWLKSVKKCGFSFKETEPLDINNNVTVKFLTKNNKEIHV